MHHLEKKQKMDPDKLPQHPVLKSVKSIRYNKLDFCLDELEIVVVGASGDLAKKKTYPALLDLFANGFIADNTKIVGFARSQMSDEDFHSKLRPFLDKMASSLNLHSSSTVDNFLQMCRYKQGQYGSIDSMVELMGFLSEWGAAPAEKVNRLFYFAIPPTVFLQTAAAIKAGGGVSPTGWTRLIVEKPFGHDLTSAQELAAGLNAHFDESYIYRIDHYLGKEMVQNLLVMRFSNIMWESIWNRTTVQSVLITFKEPFGTQGRGGYFDGSGIIRDIMQNHLMQVLTLVAMEPPVLCTGEASPNLVRDEKVKVLRSIPPARLADTVVGQYAAAADGSEAGYLEDPTVPAGSRTPTFAQTVLYVQNPRWEGVPFVLKAGKALNERKAEIRLQLRSAPAARFLFGGAACPENELVIRLQPEQAMYLKTNVKTPGLRTLPTQSELDLSYSQRFPDTYNPDAYTRLILEALRGSQATFVREDELRESWKIFDPLLKELEEKQVVPTPYDYGSRGPPEADATRLRVGYQWNADYVWTRPSAEAKAEAAAAGESKL
mmetsp:Transcript_43939/g.71725  ORF Transcript_43939/g.71725 Transcript_43939/m.71725 type:complete len:548 (-) Transcript_43939:343-1986(-)